jgi:hypothetical protein
VVRIDGRGGLCGSGESGRDMRLRRGDPDLCDGPYGGIKADAIVHPKPGDSG